MVDKRPTIERAIEQLGVVLDGGYFRHEPEFEDEINETIRELEEIYHELDDATS
jgi:hypothetical protein